MANKRTVRKAPVRSVQKSKFIKVLEKEDNFTLTENLAVTHKSTLNSVLDLFSLGGALRTREEAEIVQLFSRAYSEDSLLALKCMFYLRDVRGGQGERKSFRVMLSHLVDVAPNTAVKNIENIPFYGRYDDLLVLFSWAKTREKTLKFINDQIVKDIQNQRENQSVSLLAKWLPSENTSSKTTRQYAKIVREYLGLSSKKYRKMLSDMRKYIDIVERKMSANDWEDIDYSTVPSKASLMYRKAFSKHDGERYGEYIESVKRGEKKINAAVLYPYEIAESVLYKEENNETLEVLWKNLPDYTKGRNENAIVVADTSGSMEGRPMAISVSLAMYFAERNKGIFKDHFITFSVRPELQKVSGNTLYEKMLNLSRAQWDGNTDLQAVFNLILNTAKKNSLKQEDLPAKIYIVSDMEFDAATGRRTNLEDIKRKYSEAGYEAPTLVFWNVDSRHNQVPTTFDEKGVLLVSGASPSAFKSLMEAKTVTPEEYMLSVLNSERYEKVVA